MLCRICDSFNLESVIDLGEQPWANNFLKKNQVGNEPLYPLKVVYCHDCNVAQLDYTVKKEVMFEDHTYLSGTTKSLSNHFSRIASEVDDRFFSKEKDKSVLDIGSNDGTQLKHFINLGYEVLGVESSKTTAKIANDANVPTLNSFFNDEVARKINKKFDVINASGVFFHLEELHSVTKGIKMCLKSEGVFVVQFLYMKRIVENLAFDQIYHEHLLYYNLKTISILLEMHGLSLFDAYLDPIHGGSIIAYVTHSGCNEKTDRLIKMLEKEDSDCANDIETYKKFSKDIELVKNNNLEYLALKKKQGKIIYGMGAPVKGNTLLNYFGVGVGFIDYLVEKNELRRDLYSPGSHIPIVIEKELDHYPDVYYVLAWNFKKEILANNQRLIDAGVEFFFPVNPKEV